MPFRFRRTMKIAPGVRLNLTKTGVSARVGPRGLGLTVGTSGTTASAGIPGTGLHASRKFKKNAKKSAATTADQTPQPERKGVGFFGYVVIAAVIFGIMWLIS